MKDNKNPQRRCVGCMISKDKNELVRIAAYEGCISVDFDGRAKGRGCYICRNNSECLEKAYKRRAIERSLGVSITEEEKNKIFEVLSSMQQDDSQEENDEQSDRTFKGENA